MLAVLFELSVVEPRIITIPAFRNVTRPVGETVAVVWSLVYHFKFLFVVFSGNIVASICTVLSARGILREVLLNLTLVAGTGVGSDIYNYWTAFDVYI